MKAWTRKNFCKFATELRPFIDPFLLHVRWKSGVSFVRRCFRDSIHSCPLRMFQFIITLAPSFMFCFESFKILTH